MKKWQLEGVFENAAPRKLVLLDPDQTTVDRHSTIIEFRKDSKLISCCRRVVAFFIRFF